MYIFCSHSSKDGDCIASLKKVVEQAGHKMYLFEDDQQPGKYVLPKLERAIKRAGIVIVLITRNSAQSQWINQEIGFALALGKRVIPIVEDGISVSSLAMLQGLEYFPLAPASPGIVLGLPQVMFKFALNEKQDEIALLLLLVILLLCILYFAHQG